MYKAYKTLARLWGQKKCVSWDESVQCTEWLVGLMRSRFPGDFQPLELQSNRGPRCCCQGCLVAACTEMSVSARSLLCIRCLRGCSHPHPDSLTTQGVCHSKQNIAVVQHRVAGEARRGHVAEVLASWRPAGEGAGGLKAMAVLRA